MNTVNRKPHLLKVKTEIIKILDVEIEERKGALATVTFTPATERAFRRELAIWIKQRNRIAAETDIPLIELNHKDGQGNLIY